MSVEKLKNIFDERERFKACFNVYATTLKFLEQKKVFSPEVYQDLISKIQIDTTGIKSCSNLYSEVRESIGEEASKWIPLGPQDLEDISLSCILKVANDYVLRTSYNFRSLLIDLAIKYKEVLQLDREDKNLGLTSFGSFVSVFFDDLRDISEKIFQARKYVETVVIKDNLESPEFSCIELQDYLARHLDLFTFPTHSQLQDKERNREYLCNISAFNERCREFFDNLNLFRSFEEVSFYIADWTSIASMSERLDECIRDASNDRNQIFMVLDNFCAMLNKASEFISKLQVSEENMRKNVASSAGEVFSTRVKKALLLRSSENKEDIDMEVDRLLQKDPENFEKSFNDSRFSGLFSAEEKSKLFNLGLNKTNLDGVFKRIFEREFMKDPIKDLFFEGAEVRNAIFKLATYLNNEYRDSKEPVSLVGFTEGVIVLFGQLITQLNFPLTVITEKLSFYGSSFTASDDEEEKELAISIDPSRFENRRVLIVDDICDTGKTLTVYKKKLLETTKAKDVKICVLFKRSKFKSDYLDVDFCGFSISDEWIVGYGLDTNFKYRNIDAVGSIKEEYKK